MSGFFRSDRSPLARPAPATLFEGRVARTHSIGDGLVYSHGPEYRDAEELSKIVSQLPGLKVYLGHPNTFPASESGQAVIGYVADSRLDDDTAVAKIVLTDALEVLDETHELSLGYQATRDENGFQKNIVLDHLAVVERARCGPTCALRVDEMKIEITPEINITPSLQEKIDTIKWLAERGWGLDALKTLNVDALTCKTCDKPMSECAGHSLKEDCACKNHTMPHTNGESMANEPNTEALQAEIDNLKKKVDELEVVATNAKKDAEVTATKLAEALAAVEVAKSDAAAAVAQAKADAEDSIAKEMNARVDARVSLLAEASKVLKDTDLSKMDERAIKCAVIKHVDGDDVAEGKSMDYVTGVYEGALKRANGAAASRESVRTTINESRKDAATSLKGKDLEAAARAKMTKDSATAWTKN